MDWSSAVLFDPNEQHIQDVDAENTKARKRIATLRKEISKLEGDHIQDNNFQDTLVTVSPLEGFEPEVQLEKAQEQWLREKMIEELKTKTEKVEQLRDDIQVLENNVGEKDTRKTELTKAYEDKKQEIE